jgi:hypothetical protein
MLGIINSDPIYFKYTSIILSQLYLGIVTLNREGWRKLLKEAKAHPGL